MFAAIPKTVRFSDDGFGLFGRTQVKCGSAFDSKVEVSFDDFSEGQTYRSEVVSYGEPAIFEGKTATQVCAKSDKDSRTAGLWIGGIGVVVFLVGLNRLNKAIPMATFAAPGPSFPASSPRPPPEPAVAASPSPVPEATKVENPARWVADPFGRYDLRYWNGRKWTEHVSRDGQQDRDPPRPSVPVDPQPFAPPDPDHDGRRRSVHCGVPGGSPEGSGD